MQYRVEIQCRFHLNHSQNSKLPIGVGVLWIIQPEWVLISLLCQHICTYIPDVWGKLIHVKIMLLDYYHFLIFLLLICFQTLLIFLHLSVSWQNHLIPGRSILFKGLLTSLYRIRRQCAYHSTFCKQTHSGSHQTDKMKLSLGTMKFLKLFKLY